jgi:D-sedoheptulose 7-phosphate isomerase
MTLNLQAAEASEFVETLSGAIELAERVFIAGNGGSAAIASHAVCDLMKRAETCPVICLTDNVPMLTALSNDMDYKHALSMQLSQYRAGPDDVLIVVSSSGNSDNVVRLAEKASVLGVETFALVGMGGGRLKQFEKTDHVFHVDSNEYEIVEDFHQAILHATVKRLMSE